MRQCAAAPSSTALPYITFDEFSSLWMSFPHNLSRQPPAGDERPLLHERTYGAKTGLTPPRGGLRPCAAAPSSTALNEIREQLLYRNVKRFRGGLVLKAHRLLYHSTLGSRASKKKKRRSRTVQHRPTEVRETKYACKYLARSPRGFSRQVVKPFRDRLRSPDHYFMREHTEQKQV